MALETLRIGVPRWSAGDAEQALRLEYIISGVADRDQLAGDVLIALGVLEDEAKPGFFLVMQAHVAGILVFSGSIRRIEHCAKCDLLGAFPFPRRISRRPGGRDRASGAPHFAVHHHGQASGGGLFLDKCIGQGHAAFQFRSDRAREFVSAQALFECPGGAGLHRIEAQQAFGGAGEIQRQLIEQDLSHFLDVEHLQAQGGLLPRPFEPLHLVRVEL
ncbi:hypothetical protein D3C73_786660 [compost metagenome]